MNGAPKGYSLLFLSCDLTGSTHFKQEQGRLAEIPAGHREQVPWQKTFLQFYREFPQELEATRRREKTTDLQFELWKPVGDELIFTCLVRSENDVYRAVRTWTKTLHQYRVNSLDGLSLGTKGGAFIATFPGPDSQSSIPRRPEDETSGQDVVDLNRQALEGKRAHSKYLYDYFGPSIDTGFRVLSKSSARHFTLSVEVAFALSCASQNPGPNQSLFHLDDIVLLDAGELKGVWGGKPYPLFALDLEAETLINQAFAPFIDPRPAAGDVMKLCAACFSATGAPFAMYLPNSVNDHFLRVPVDPLAGYKTDSISGAETVPSQNSHGTDLKDGTPPLG